MPTALAEPLKKLAVVGRRSWRSATGRQLLFATVVGVALRLAWVLWATRSPSNPFSDAAQYQQIAEGLVDRRTPSIGGVPTAFYPPGWPTALAPLVWITAKTGLLSLPFAVALLNVAAGGASIGLTAALAGRWIGPGASVPAAWMMAIAPGAIYFTSTQLAETWFTAVLLLAMWLLTAVMQGDRRTPQLVAIGLVVGYAALIRSPGLVLLAFPALSARTTDGRWRGALRPTLAVLAGALVVLLPWMVRNGVQVGVWTPLSTNNASFSCVGNGDGASGANDTSETTSRRCYRYSPWDNPVLYGDDVTGLAEPDEARWYRETLGESVGWMARHPADDVRLAAYKTYLTLGSSQDGLVAAEDDGQQPFVRGIPRDLLSRAADVWQWGVLVLGILGLAFVPRCRRALPVWSVAALQLALIWGGIGMDRYNHPIMPLVVMLAAGTIDALRAGARTPDAEDQASPADGASAAGTAA